MAIQALRAREDYLVQKSVAGTSVKSRDEAALSGAAGRNASRLRAKRGDSALHCLCDELRPVISEMLCLDVGQAARASRPCKKIETTIAERIILSAAN
jgi:hypothetical protein